MKIRWLDWSEKSVHNWSHCKWFYFHDSLYFCSLKDARKFDGCKIWRHVWQPLNTSALTSFPQVVKYITTTAIFLYQSYFMLNKLLNYQVLQNLFLSWRMRQDLKVREVTNDGYYSCTYVAPLDDHS